MVKQKTPKGAAAPAAPEDAITDPRFASFSTDPRFRLPSKKASRTKIDKRFSRMLKDDDFVNTAKVDRYGRKLSNTWKEQALRRLYQPEEEDDESGVEEDVEVEDDEVVASELKKADAAYDPARGGGFSSSDEDEDEEEEEEEDGGVEVAKPEFPALQAEQSEVPMGEVTTRIAVVNMDWDNVRAVDLMAVFSSFVRPGGSIKKVSVYPSEFGKERMEREEMEGPPKELFAKKTDVEEEEEESDSEDEIDEEALDEKIKKDLLKEDKGEEVDSTALRQYQLERLRYYYAIIICSDTETANQIYTATDGTEYLSSANFFDLRFVPDDVEFDDKPRDECTSVPGGYRPTEFVTDALQHSKVKLSWDAEDGERKNIINRAFTGSRAEIGENDLRAYLGSDSSSDEDDDDAAPAEADGEAKPTKKELARQKLRAALGLSDEPNMPSKSKAKGPVGDLQISFTPGLSAQGASKGSVFENEPIKEETTAEAYIRKEKERKARRREKAKALRGGRDPDAAKADSSAPKPEADKEKAKEDEDLGFADPFFTADAATREKTTKSKDKEARRAKRAQKDAEAAAQAAERARLELLMVDDNIDVTGAGEGTRLDHFDINEIERAEKAAKKKKRTRSRRTVKGDDADGSAGIDGIDRSGKLQQSFRMPVDDLRFAALYEKHEYAIDPSNPRFRGTEGMKALLEEGRRKRKIGVGAGGDVDGDEESGKGKKDGQKKKGAKNAGNDDLLGLVESVKKKVRR